MFCFLCTIVILILYFSFFYLLQSVQAHERTKEAVRQFLENEGPILQEKLQTYATTKSSYIEEFW